MFPKEARARGPASAEDLRVESLSISRAGRATPYTGVHWEAERELWRADAYRADRSGYDIIGFVQDDREAAIIRDRVMLHIHGDEAVLNFPNERKRPLSLEAARKMLGHRARVNKSSPYLGVDLRRGRWAASITVEGERFSLGTFDEEVDAARAYDRAALYLRGPSTKLNFPKRRSAPASPKQLRRASRAQRKAGTTSRYVGVAWSEQSSAWSVHIYSGGSHLFIGNFEDEEEAALAYDAVALHLFGRSAPERLNFPERRTSPRSIAEIRSEVWSRFKSGTSSRYTGVSWSKVESLWRATISVDGITHQLGAFENEVHAARAYDKAALALLGPTAFVNFPWRGAQSKPTPRSGRRG